MLSLRHQNGTVEELFSVDALERHQSFRACNLRRIAQEYHGVGVIVGDTRKLFVRADKLAVALGKPAEDVLHYAILADADDDIADGVILPAAESERQAEDAARRRKADAAYSASLSR